MSSTNLTSLPASVAVLQEVPDAVRIVQSEEANSPPADVNPKQQVQAQPGRPAEQPKIATGRKSILPKSRSTGAVFEGNLTSAEAQQVSRGMIYFGLFSCLYFDKLDNLFFF